jgi:hypothetical protein
MSDRASTSEHRKKSAEKKATASEKVEKQRRFAQEATRVMKRVESLGTSGFADTDQMVTKGAEQLGASAERAGLDDAQKTAVATKELGVHAGELDKIARRAETEKAKTSEIRTTDRLNGAETLRAGYEKAESVSTEISADEKRKASETNKDSRSLLERIKADAKRRPSFR